MKTKEIIFLFIGFLLLVFFCSMGTITKNMYPLFRIDQISYDNATNIREVFLSMFHFMMLILITLLAGNYIYLKIFCVFFSGICASDMCDKIHHHINNKYITDKITQEDVFIMCVVATITVIIFYKNKYGNRENSRPIKGS